MQGKFGASRGGRHKAETSQSGAIETVTSHLSRLILPSSDAPSPERSPRSYGTASGAEVDAEADAAAGMLPGKSSSSTKVTSLSKEESGLSKLFAGSLGGDFSVDTHTIARARIRATFYPKFENEKSDQEVRPQFTLHFH